MQTVIVYSTLSAIQPIVKLLISGKKRQKYQHLVIINYERTLKQ